MRAARNTADAATRVAYFDRLSEELSRVDGVEAVGAVDLTFQFNWQTTTVRAGADRASAPNTALDRAATSTYLDVSGVTLVDGRWLEAQDRSRRRSPWSVEAWQTSCGRTSARSGRRCRWTHRRQRDAR